MTLPVHVNIRVGEDNEFRINDTMISREGGINFNFKCRNYLNQKARICSFKSEQYDKLSLEEKSKYDNVLTKIEQFILGYKGSFIFPTNIDQFEVFWNIGTVVTNTSTFEKQAQDIHKFIVSFLNKNECFKFKRISNKINLFYSHEKFQKRVNDDESFKYYSEALNNYEPQKLLHFTISGINHENYAAPPTQFHACHNLLTLTLQGNCISEEYLKALGNFKNLQTLKFQNQRLDVPFDIHLPALKQLELGSFYYYAFARRELQDETLEKMSRMPFQAPNLTVLSIGRYSLSNVNFLSQFPSITELYLSYAEIENYDGIKELKHLTTLHLHKDEGCTNNIIDLSFLNSGLPISILGLANTVIKDLSPIEKVPSIRSLFLQNADINSLRPITKLGRLDRIGLPNDCLYNKFEQREVQEFAMFLDKIDFKLDGVLKECYDSMKKAEEAEKKSKEGKEQKT